MSDNFLPPNFDLPPQPSSGGDFGSNLNTGPQLNNSAPNYEKQSPWSRIVARSARIKQAATAVIKTRSQFKSYLKEQGMDLYTSAVEFQHSGDFIISSYVVYQNYGNYMEPLASFLQRYPQLQAPVIAIRDRLRPVKQGMQVISPRPDQVWS